MSVKKPRPLRWKWQDAWATDRNVPDSIARTLVCCQVFMNSDSALMWASEKQLAEARGLSERQVSRHLSRIVELGYLRVHAKGGGTVVRRINGELRKVGRTTEYAIAIPGHPECHGINEAYPDISHPIPRHLDSDTPTFSGVYPDTLDVRGTDSLPIHHREEPESEIVAPEANAATSHSHEGGRLRLPDDEPFTALASPGQCRTVIGIQLARMLGRIPDGASDADRFATGQATAAEIPEQILGRFIDKMQHGRLRPSEVATLAEQMKADVA